MDAKYCVRVAQSTYRYVFDAVFVAPKKDAIQSLGLFIE